MQSNQVDTDSDGTGGITLNFGKTVGDGIQGIACGKTWEQVAWEQFLLWPLDILDADTKRKKGFFLALAAIKKFEVLWTNTSLREYEVVIYNDKPATELSIYIDLPNGFKHRGFIDIVLRHKLTGEIIVLEAKTTWFADVAPATYKNSSQALGYSIALDTMFPGLSSYKVIYLIYKTTSFEWEMMSFNKDTLMRAQWIQEVLHDISDIELYERSGVYPMRGESCRRYNRDCGYFGLCQMNTKYLTQEIAPETLARYEKEQETASIRINLEQIIAAQLEKL